MKIVKTSKGGIHMKMLIKNGLIADGSGKKVFKGAVEITGDKISNIGDFNQEGYDMVIDAQGNIIAPGFIDTHSHSDLRILLDPYVEPKVRQGITTEILGQDGISMAPLPIKYINTWRKNIAGLEGDSDAIDWTYKTTDGYLNQISKGGVGPNVAYLVPHGNIRMEAMGFEDRKPTAQELQHMKEITRREMKAGAFGLSSGLVYMPCTFSTTSEIVELCKIVADYDGIFVVHQRNESEEIISALEEVLEIGRRSGVKVHFSHFKVCGKRNWDKVSKMIELLEEAKSEGIRVSFDQYPYTAGSTMLALVLPPWVHNGGTEMLLERLADLNLRKKMVRDMVEGILGWESIIKDSGPERVFISSVETKKNRDFIGKNLIEIGEMSKKNPYDAVFDLLIEEKNAIGMIIFSGTEENVVSFMKRPEQNVCTDGLLGGKPHPRVYGAFTRVLGKYVRQENILGIEEAIRKMTSKPAATFGIQNRGALLTGYFADVVILNPDTIIDKATFEEPIQYSEGIEMVIINGKVILEQGNHTKEISGKVLRKV